MRRQPVATAAKPDAKWVEPAAEVRIANRGGLTAELVRRPVFEGLVEAQSRVLGKRNVSVGATVGRKTGPPQSAGFIQSCAGRLDHDQKSN